MENIELEEVKHILVSRKQIEWVAYNFTFSEHSLERIVERDVILGRDFKSAILNSPMFWRINDKEISIALDLYRYIIVVFDKEKAVIKTFADTRDSMKSGKTVVEKMFIDYKKYMRS